MSSTPAPLRAPATGFRAGYTPITTPGAPHAGEPDSGMEFGIRVQAAAHLIEETSPLENAWVLLRGAAEVTAGPVRATVRRESIFDEPPTVLHVPRGTSVKIRSVADATEWAVVRTANEKTF